MRRQALGQLLRASLLLQEGRLGCARTLSVVSVGLRNPTLELAFLQPGLLCLAVLCRVPSSVWQCRVRRLPQRLTRAPVAPPAASPQLAHRAAADAPGGLAPAGNVAQALQPTSAAARALQHGGWSVLGLPACNPAGPNVLH